MKAKLESMFATALTAVMLLCLVIGCTRTVYVPLESSRRDSVSYAADTASEHFQSLISELHRVTASRDSIVIRDSVIVVVNAAGDIIGKEVFHDRDRSHYDSKAIAQIRASYDSILAKQKAELTSIIERYEQTPVEIERRPSTWEKIKSEAVSIFVCFLIATVLTTIAWFATKIKP